MDENAVIDKVCKHLGDEFVDYTEQPFENVVRDVDVVYDLVGGDTFERAFHVLKKDGFLVTSVAFPNDEAQRFGVSVKRGFCVPNAEELAAIARLVDDGKVKPHVSTVLPLAEVGQALELSKGRRTRGKIVLQIAE